MIYRITYYATTKTGDNSRASLVRVLAFIFLALSDSVSAELEPDLHNEPIQPLPMVNSVDPGKTALGRQLFYENRLSLSGKFSCASCHDLNSNGADGRMHSIAHDDTQTNVNTLTIFNSGYNDRLFWDGRAENLAQQIDFVITGPREFNNSWPNIVATLKTQSNYAQQFREVYQRDMQADDIRDALASFVRSLVTINSRFDQYLRGNLHAINAQEKAGYHLFKIYGCIACHQGRNVGGNLFQKLGVFKDYYDYHNSLKHIDFGRYNHTGNEIDLHVFRVPSLRLVVLTPPYFHDGSAATLKEAIKIMAEYQLGRNIPDHDIELIISFLKTLPGEYNGHPVRKLEATLGMKQ